MNQFHKTALDNQGFTMIEVVAILIVIGVITAVAVSRVISTQQDLISEADIVMTHLRFAQLKALHDDTKLQPLNWGIAFAGSSYTLYYNGAPANISLPGYDPIGFPPGVPPDPQPNTHSLRSGITVTNPSTINFNSWGSPGAVDVSLTLSDGTAPKTITVTGNTGYITITP